MIIDPKDASIDDTQLTCKEKERYMLFHPRFAYLGLQKLRNFHLVTNLTRPIKVLESREECI